MTESETMMLIKFIWAGWPTYTIEPETVAHFHTCLKERTLVEMRDAAIEAIKKNRSHPPGVGELLEIHRQHNLRNRTRQLPQLPASDSKVNLELVAEMKRKHPGLFV